MFVFIHKLCKNLGLRPIVIGEAFPTTLFASRPNLSHKFSFFPTQLPINRSTTNNFTMPLKSRVLCCSNNRAAVADAYSPIPTQTKKVLINRDNVTEKSSITSSEPAVETRTSLDKEQVKPSETIFRTPSLISEDGDDMLSLKRANPVYESDDEEAAEYYSMPSKRQRTTSTTELTLCWEDKIVETEEEGYQIIIGL